MKGRLSGRVVPVIAALVLGALATACGDTTTVREASTSPPLTASSVRVEQTGNAKDTVMPATVTYRLDDARLLVIRATLTSQSSTTDDVSARASLYDQSDRLVGDAVAGSSINLAPGGSAQLQLSGPTPHGTIARAVFEVDAVPAPTNTTPTPSPSS